MERLGANTVSGSQFFTIQAGVDAAVSGDTLAVYSGAYTESIQILNKTNIRLIALDWITNSNNNTTILGKTGAVNNIITLNGSTGVIVEGFTITNGDLYGISFDINSHFNKVANNNIISNTNK